MGQVVGKTIVVHNKSKLKKMSEVKTRDKYKKTQSIELRKNRYNTGEAKFANFQGY